MAKVLNASGVYATLGYNFSDPNNDVKNLSANTVSYLDTTPPFIEPWQAQDIANNDIGGYYQNPVAGDVGNIITISQNMMTVANTGVSQNLENSDLVLTAANSLYANAVSFLEHTDRLSGVTAFVGQDIVNPYYDTAIPLGKTALYITNQTDSITNTSPILGSFTSILVGPQIEEQKNLIFNTLVQLTSAVDANNLPITEATQIISEISNTNTFLTSRQSADVTYFTNLRAFVDKYNTVKKFSSMGETETYLVNNFIGTQKIKQRINS